MFVNDELNADVVHGQRATKGAGFAHQDRALLAQGTVNGLHNAGLPTAFRAGPMRSGRQDLGVGLPFVGEVPGARAIRVWQGGPQAPQRGRPPAPAAQHPGHDAAAVTLDGQPEPDFALFAPHKRPHLIEFEYPGPARFGPQVEGGRCFFLPI